MAVKLVQGELVVPFKTLPDGNVPAVAGTIRLVSAKEVRAFYETEYDALRSRHGDSVSAEAHLYARLIRSWDVVGADDRPAPVTPENVAALPSGVFAQLGRVATGAAAEPVLGN